MLTEKLKERIHPCDIHLITVHVIFIDWLVLSASGIQGARK